MKPITREPCALKSVCATYTRPMRLCKCERARVQHGVLDGIRAFKTDYEIALELGISGHAVQRAAVRAMKEYGASNRAHLILRVEELG